MTEHLMSAATVFLMVFGMVAAVDGLYLHLWKYRLYARPESRREHKPHTAQDTLFVPVVFILFYGDFGGAALWAGVLHGLTRFDGRAADGRLFRRGATLFRRARGSGSVWLQGNVRRRTSS